MCCLIFFSSWMRRVLWCEDIHEFRKRLLWVVSKYLLKVVFLQSGEKNSAEFNFSVWPYYPCRPLLWNSLTAVHNTIWKSDLSFVSKSCISNPHEEKRRLKNTPWGTDGETNPKYTCECVRVRARVLSWGRLGNSQSVVYCTDLNLSSPSFFYLLHRFFFNKIFTW